MKKITPDQIQTLTSNEIDSLLGIQDTHLLLKNPHYEKEKELYTDGLTSADALYTDYRDFASLYDSLIESKINSFCDLGSGIGRSKLLFDHWEAPFQSYALEFVKERHDEGLRVHQSLALQFPEGFINANLKEEAPPLCDAYFIYLPVGDVLFATLKNILHQHREKSALFYVIESHGDLISYLEMALPNLIKREEIPLTGKRHSTSMHVYSLPPTKNFLSLEKAYREEILNHEQGFSIHTLTDFHFLTLFHHFRNHRHAQVVIKQEDQLWLADTWEWKFGIQPRTFELHCPYRIISFDEISGIMIPHEDWLKDLIAKRRSGERGPLGEIRKLFVFPSLQVEYSSGSKKELEVSWTWETLPTLGVD